MFDEMKPFWIVMGDAADSADDEPSKGRRARYTTLQSAEAEADRLARKNPGKRFFTLMAVSSCEHSAVKWERVAMAAAEPKPSELKPPKAPSEPPAAPAARRSMKNGAGAKLDADAD